MVDYVTYAPCAAGKMDVHKRAEQCPAQSGPMRNRGVYIGNRRDPLINEMKGLAPQGRLEPNSLCALSPRA